MKTDRRFCAIMFADVVHSSELTVDIHKSQLAQVLDRHLETARAYGTHLFSKAMGDGLLVCFGGCSDLAELALNLRHEFATTDWKRRGFPRDLQIRIGLDFQIITLRIDDHGADGSSAGLDRASRVEPITPPNAVYCTDLFYKGLHSERITKIIGEYLGEMDLAKNAGREILYNLKWVEQSVRAQLEPGGPAATTTAAEPGKNQREAEIGTIRSNRRPRLPNIAVPTAIGDGLVAELGAASNTSGGRHLLLQDATKVIGVLVDADEFNLLMKLSDLMADAAALSEMIHRPKDVDDDDLTATEVFGENK